MQFRKNTRRWLIAGALITLAVAAGAVFGGPGNGVAAGQVAPSNQSPPVVTGTPEEGMTLTTSNGTWNGTTPFTYVYQWRRCDSTGGSCSSISGSNSSTYVLKPVDVGNTIRARVTARNGQGSAQSSSVPTAVIKAKTPATTNGCPTSGTGTLDIKDATPPARLLIDGQQISPSVVTRSTQDITVRFHVSACGGRPVQGALLYATAVPFSQFTIPPEATTGADGWASLTMHQDRFFPASSRQQLLVMQARARKATDPVLAGISTQRLVSFPVKL